MLIPGFNGRYDISTDGKVVDTITGKVKHIHLTKRYAKVSLKRPDGTWRLASIIRLLAETYKPLYVKYPETYYAYAVDGDYTHTDVTNACWRRKSDIMIDLWKNGKLHRLPRKCTTCTDESMQMMLDALAMYDAPVTAMQLHIDLEIPYSVSRYSLKALVDNGLVLKNQDGYRLVR